MTVTLTWPSRLPLPSMQGYGIEDDLRIERSEMESGSERERRTSTALKSAVQVQWKFTLFEYALFEGWLIHRARGQWFNMAYLGGIGLIACEARIQRGKAPSKFQTGASVIVTATLDIRDRPIVTDAELTELLAVEEASVATLFAEIADAHGVIDHDLWS
ncbi:MAG: hypothetical protein ACK4JB_17260 [Reyranella sp.]